MASYRDPALDWVPTAGQVVPVDWMADLTGNDEFFYGDTIWTGATLSSPWTNHGSGFFSVGYRLAGSTIRLRGCAAAGSAVTGGATIFTLPTGYRPTANAGFAVGTFVSSAWGTAAIQVNSTGTVVIGPSFASGGLLFFDNVSFDNLA